jgi:hypothetical protein
MDPDKRQLLCAAAAVCAGFATIMRIRDRAWSAALVSLALALLAAAAV